MSGVNMKDLRLLAAELNEIYNTTLTNELVLLADAAQEELREYQRCMCCQGETTRWFCDKSHQLN